MGLLGPGGMTSGMLADQSECGLYHGELASFFWMTKSPFGVGNAARPGAHG